VLATAPCQAWPRGVRFKLLPHYQQWAAADEVTGELFTGPWRNVTSVADVEALNSGGIRQ
jgi:hypothetical protein